MLQKIRLLQAGDVELNPGPDTQGLYAKLATSFLHQIDLHILNCH